MQKAKQIISIVLIALIAVIAFQNIQNVETNVLFWTFSLPRFVLLVVVFFIGFLAGKVIKLRKK